MKYVGNGEVWSRQRSGRFIQSAINMFREHGYGQWAMIHKSDQQLIGYCGFVETDNDPEIGWRLAPEHWGKGLATEAARAILKHGFETLHFERVTATVQAENAASIRVSEKLGMTLERSFHRDEREVLVCVANSRRL